MRILSSVVLLVVLLQLPGPAQVAAKDKSREHEVPALFRNSGCVRSEKWVTPVDTETGKALDKEMPVHLVQITCPDYSAKKLPPTRPEASASRTLNCPAYNMGVSVTWQVTRGTGSEVFYYEYVDELGRTRTANIPSQARACPADACWMYSGEDQYPDRRWKYFSVGWTTAVNITGHTCWHF